jgi:hypothetical protein
VFVLDLDQFCAVLLAEAFVLHPSHFWFSARWSLAFDLSSLLRLCLEPGLVAGSVPSSIVCHKRCLFWFSALGQSKLPFFLPRSGFRLVQERLFF